MKKSMLFFALMALSFMAVNAQHMNHNVTRNDIKSGSMFIPFTFADALLQYETWTVKSGNLSIVKDGIGKANLYGTGNFEFVYYGYYSSTKSVTITVKGYFSSGSGSGNGGGGWTKPPLNFEHADDNLILPNDTDKKN